MIRPSIAVLLLLLWALPSWADESSSGTPIRLHPVVDGLGELTNVVASSNDPSTVYVVEREGTVRVVRNGKISRTALLDLESMIDTRKSRGLLGIALAPDFTTSRIVYVHYIDPQGDAVIGHLTTLVDDTVEDDSLVVTMKLAQPFSNSNTGHIRFGPDGFLYITSGDGGAPPAARQAVQRLDSLSGKLLRINPSTGTQYNAPHDNPFRNRPKALPEIWAVGFRNPTHISFDRDNGRLFLVDIHEGSGELNIIERGKNYGWGIATTAPCLHDLCENSPPTPPIFTLTSTVPHTTLIGGVVYRGAAIPQLRGRYIFADGPSGQLYTLLEVSGSWKSQPLAQLQGHTITSIDEDSAGEIYVATREGVLFAITR